jgi:hypothetical protein
LKLVVSFFSPLEDIALKRTNLAIKNVLNALDVSSLRAEDRDLLRKIILDEINGVRNDLLDYFKKTREI